MNAVIERIFFGTLPNPSKMSLWQFLSKVNHTMFENCLRIELLERAEEKDNSFLDVRGELRDERAL
jgi:hypothetical protein